eukprot:COSAG06_NODE_1857_length_8210_cov_45.445691_6_plen_64_part_00
MNATCSHAQEGRPIAYPVLGGRLADSPREPAARLRRAPERGRRHALAGDERALRHAALYRMSM